MGCFQIAVAALGLILIVLFFYAVKAAIYAIIVALVCGGIGAMLNGREGMQIGAVAGFVIGILWAFVF